MGIKLVNCVGDYPNELDYPTFVLTIVYFTPKGGGGHSLLVYRIHVRTTTKVGLNFRDALRVKLICVLRFKGFLFRFFHFFHSLSLVQNFPSIPKARKGKVKEHFDYKLICVCKYISILCFLSVLSVYQTDKISLNTVFSLRHALLSKLLLCRLITANDIQMYSKIYILRNLR